MRGIIEEAGFIRMGHYYRCHYGWGVCIGRVRSGETVQKIRLLATCRAEGGSQRGPGCSLDAIQCHARHGGRSGSCRQQKLVAALRRVTFNGVLRVTGT